MADIHVAIMSTNSNKSLDLYTKDSNVEFIAYVQIYPHRLHYDSEIYYIKDEQPICIFPNSENTIDLLSSSDIVNKKRIFDLLKTKMVKHMFNRFDESIDNGSIFDVIENISRLLMLI